MARIMVFVKSHKDGKSTSGPLVPVANASIFWNGEKVGETNQQGQCELDLPDGNYTIEGRKSGVSQTSRIRLPRKTPVTIVLPGDPPRGVSKTATSTSTATNLVAGNVFDLYRQTPEVAEARAVKESESGSMSDQNQRNTKLNGATMQGGVAPSALGGHGQPPAGGGQAGSAGGGGTSAGGGATGGSATGGGGAASGGSGAGQPPASPPPPAPQGRGAGQNLAVPVTLRPSQVPDTPDEILWTTIRNRTNAIRFGGYASFIDSVLCGGADPDARNINNPNRLAPIRQRNELFSPIHGVGAYELLKTATQVFLLLEAGTVLSEFERHTNQPLYDADEEERRTGEFLTFSEAEARLATYLGANRLPYIQRVLNTAFVGRAPQDRIFCPGFLVQRADRPLMLELIWSYWHEEAMLVQTMKAISLRFQNRHTRSERDPLANVEIAPLYPLNNLLWGYIQDEVHSLTVARRNYEYSHHYGLTLQGRAISDFRPADPRSRFLEAFHNMLFRTALFFKQDDDNTYSADAFPLLNALREVHLVLAEGAHNQFGDLPWTARADMLMEQWILARPETRLFLQSRDMVPYREAWMPQVDAMKQLQGWTDVSVTHFNFLAVHGEQLLLSIRYGDWIAIDDPASAANWARYWRPEIQNYIHAYRAVTGVDLAADANDSRQSQLMVTQPSELLRQRLEESQTSRARLTAPTPAPPKRFRERRAMRISSNGNN